MINSRRGTSTLYTDGSRKSAAKAPTAPFGSLAPMAAQQPKTVVGASATGRAKPLLTYTTHGRAAAREMARMETEAKGGPGGKPSSIKVTHGKAAEREMAQMERSAAGGHVKKG
jgi:hypothetical protein